MMQDKAINIDELVLALISNPRKKTCTKCGIEKSLDEFRNRKEQKSGKHSYCKICEKEYQRKYDALPTTKERQRKYRALPTTKERKRKYNRKYSDLPASKERQRKYSDLPTTKERKRKYNALPTTKERKRKYEALPATKERERKYRALPATKEYRRKYKVFQVNNLTDSYIIDRLSLAMKMSYKEAKQLPELSELIEQKRVIIQLKRGIKQLKQKENETS